MNEQLPTLASRASFLLALFTLGCGAAAPRGDDRIEDNAGQGVEDRDGDRIADRCDQCPTEPEDYDLTQDADGCPEDITISASRHALVRSVYFEQNDAALSETQRAAVAQLYGELTSHNRATDVRCFGRAGAEEADAIALSERRAAAVCDALVEEGIANEVLTAHALGVRSPFDPSDREQGEQAWRVYVLVAQEELVDHWYRPRYRFTRWTGERLELVDQLVDAEPMGPPRCPGE